MRVAYINIMNMFLQQIGFFNFPVCGNFNMNVREIVIKRQINKYHMTWHFIILTSINILLFDFCCPKFLNLFFHKTSFWKMCRQMRVQICKDIRFTQFERCSLRKNTRSQILYESEYLQEVWKWIFTRGLCK